MGYIEHIGHKKCGSTDGLATYKDDEGGFNGFCWACGEYESNPYGDNPPKKVKIKRSPEEIQEELDLIESCPTVSVNPRS